jgi:hypothetical protein
LALNQGSYQVKTIQAKTKPSLDQAKDKPQAIKFSQVNLKTRLGLELSLRLYFKFQHNAMEFGLETWRLN